MGWFRRERSANVMPRNVSAGLGALVKQAMLQGYADTGGMSITLVNCDLSGEPIGDWQVTVARTRRPASGIEAATADETQSGSTEGESPAAASRDARKDPS